MTGLKPYKIELVESGGDYVKSLCTYKCEKCGKEERYQSLLSVKHFYCYQCKNIIKKEREEKQKEKEKKKIEQLLGQIWFPLSQKVPKRNTNVIFQGTKGGIYIGQYQGDKDSLRVWDSAENGYIPRKCVAWMPLPKPYEGVSE